MSLKTGILGCLFLCLVTLGLQLAACITNGWLIIEGDNFEDDNPWFKVRFPLDSTGDKHHPHKPKSGSVKGGVWYVLFCRGEKCEEIYDYRATPGQNVRYFEGLPIELQACSVLGIAFAAFSLLAFKPLLRTYKDDPKNCWGMFISILLFFSGITTLTLIFLALNMFSTIEEVFDHGGYDDIRSTVPYSFILAGTGTATALVAALIMSIVCCKIHHAVEGALMKERKSVEDERKKQEEIQKHHIIPDRKTFNSTEKKPIHVKDKEQVVYSIHL